MDSRNLAVEAADGGDHYKYRYVPGRSIACLIRTPNIGLVPLHPHANQQAFAPNCERILASTMGIILSFPYTVFNPYYGQGVEIPMPAHANPNDPHALVIRNSPPSLNIVWASSVGRQLYRFNAYCYARNAWRDGPISTNLGDIVANSGVSCNGWGYWLTKRPLFAVIFYDTENFKYGLFHVPEKFRVDSCPPCQMQLGTQGGNRLLLLIAMENEIEVYTSMQEPHRWECSFRMGFRSRWPPIPIRSQSRMFQALFRVDDRLLVFERKWNDERPLRRRWGKLPHPESDVTEDFVPLMETTLQPVDFNPVLSPQA